MRAGLLVVLVIAATPPPARAWGFEAHRFIVDRAIDLLPPAIRPFYQAHRRFIVEHTVDPDLWRLAGFEQEPPRHFMDLDAYAAFPFDSLPRDYDRAVERYGVDMLQREGVLPWRAVEIHERLRRAFEDHPKGSRRALDNAQFFSAVVAHYVADAHVPFHAVQNHDGQLTNQQGIHARFETDLFMRFRHEIRVSPSPPRTVADVRGLMFETLIESFGHAETVLKADLAARRSPGDYDRAYYRRFFNAVRPLLEQRMSAAITAIAAVWQTAWEGAGRPSISTVR
jgi:hypothetical protein